jgi:hypothetical protein
MNFWLAGITAGQAFTVDYGTKSEYVVPYAGTSGEGVYIAGHSMFDDVLAGYTAGDW